MKTKKEVLQMHIRLEDFDSALKTASKFVRDFNPDEQRDIQISAECINNSHRRQFYTQLGWDVSTIREDAEKALRNWYSNSLGKQKS
jgi:hypothetical protein